MKIVVECDEETGQIILGTLENLQSVENEENFLEFEVEEE